MDQPNRSYRRDGGNYNNSPTAVSPSGVLTLDREKPNNQDAEIAVLGAMLIDADAASVALGRLNFQGAFYSPAHQMIFDAMVALNPKGDAALDPVVLADYLRQHNQLDQVGGASYLAQLMDKVPTAAHIDHYIEIVKQNAILRRIIATCSESILKCYEAEGKAEDLLDTIEKEVMEVSQMNQRQDYLTIAPLVDNAMEYIVKLIMKESDDYLGVPTGYEVLDKSMTGGLKPGMLFVLAARPSIGKTALALNMAYNIAVTNQTSVGFFSLEMSADQLTLRLISSGARVNITELAYQSSQPAGDLQKIKTTCNDLRKANFVIDETGGIDILELRSKARRMVEKHGIKVLFIDYLQLISINSNKNANRENDVARISGALKALAKELAIPIVVLAQLNRQAEQGDALPKLSNLRESGAIEQDADVVALLHRNREEQYSREGDHTQGLDAVLLIAKNRNGQTGKQPLTFFPYFTRFDAREETISDEDIPQKK